ncbi:hypothetical protein GCM10027403_36550 [Arthrobacter tecti]
MGVTPARVRALIDTGKLRAEKVGNQWVLDELEVQRYRRNPPGGRPVTPGTAWGFLAFLDAARFEQLEDDWQKIQLKELPSLNSQVLRRWRNWMMHLMEPAVCEEALLSLLSKVEARAERCLFVADRADIQDLRVDPRLMLSGVSHPASSLLSNSEVEAYIDDDDVERLKRDFFLVPAKNERAANVILHVAEELPEKLPLAAVAADLAEHNGPREQNEAARILRSIVGH